MMMQTEKLIQTLLEQTRETINIAERLQHETTHALTWKENAQSWSILECLEHLNRYGDFYFPHIEKEIKKTKTAAVAEFKAGILGSYFAKSMLSKEKLNKMKTFKDKNPLNSNLDTSVIQTFIHQQMKLVDLLAQARNVNLNKVKIKTSISPLIRLKLGDTFQFIINHNIRHLKQIERIKENLKGA